MTNDIAPAENCRSKGNKTSTKNSVDPESPPLKRTTDSSCSPRKKLEGQAITVEQEASKNNISKTRITKKNKKKLNFDNKISLTENNDEQKTPDKSHRSSITSKSHVNKENQSTNSNKSKLFSPNHKLTEYFSDLKVQDNSQDVQDDQNLDKKQTDQQDKKQSSNLNSNQSLSGTPSKSAKRRLRQRRARLSIESYHKVTDYFPVRRSERKDKKNILDEKQKELENKIVRQVEDGLKVTEIEGKGRGVVTTKDFCKGDFVVEYIGNLIDGATAKIRETKYAKNESIGCYMYYFKFKNTQYCIDATKESGKLGRLINHSRKGNLVSKVIEINQSPHLVLFAKTDIPAGIELLYDYGDRNKESVKHHPWLTL